MNATRWIFASATTIACGCTSTEPLRPPPVEARAPTPTAERSRPTPAGPVAHVARLRWPSWDVRLAALDDGRRRAIVWMQRPGHVSIAAIGYDGTELERWDSTPSTMPSAGRFEARGSSLRDDVRRYAAMLGDGHGRYVTPAVILAPGGKHV
ncbi:MAG: hypothetical protein AAF721_37970, partial [Myxococcota bacterium]